MTPTAWNCSNSWITSALLPATRCFCGFLRACLKRDDSRGVEAVHLGYEKTQLYPTDLTDRQWDCIKELIPPAKPGGRPRTLDMRAVINGILYVVVSGCQWRMLPREYPAWQSVYMYFQQWREDGTWQRLHDTLRAQVRRRACRHKHPTAERWIAKASKRRTCLG